MIADDYISKDYCPGSENYGIYDNGNGYRLSMNDIIKDYPNGSKHITDSKIQALNSSYFGQGFSSTNINMKAVAYMLDTGVWNVFKGDYAEYAIGGPTIEMLFNSYNEKHPNSSYPSGKYQARASNATGYQISTNAGQTWSDYMSAKTEYLDSSDSLYVINSNEKAYAMLVASPSNYNSSHVNTVAYDGYVYSRGYDYSDVGFRPIVCLKTSTQLKKKDDGNFEIYKPETVDEIVNKTVPVNTEVTDSEGNKITIPEGFKIRVDDSTNNATKVTDGIVIEDGEGNQFVWVPVGNISNGEKTENIKLDRYTFADDGTETGQGSNVIEYYYSETLDSEFEKSVSSRGGYYIARYEASENNSKAEVKANASVWNYVGQTEAIEACESMYGTTSYTTTLMNSYAWDTALVFIQKFSGDTDYSKQISLNSKLSDTGTSGDNKLNINDMASNVTEWTTEECGATAGLKTLRGGDYGNGDASTRGADYGEGGGMYTSGFRPILYINEYIETSKDYRGYYADVDGNGSVDGIIYADLAVGGSGQWTDEDGTYEIPKVESGLRNYYISQEGYEGPFGTKDVLRAEGRGEDRFYIMALEDIDESQYYWYYDAAGVLDNPISRETNDFGKGRENTKILLEGKYGAENSKDMWKRIESEVGDINNPTWFVPSKSEWSAFVDYMTKELGMDESNYNSKFGLNNWYWASSQYNAYNVYYVNLSEGYVYYTTLDSLYYVRLSTTF